MPKITSPVQNSWENVNQTDSIKLTCQGVGIPAPKLEWKMGSTLLSSQAGANTINTEEQMTTVEHMVSNATAAESGIYTCKASRDLLGTTRTDERIVTLNVQSECPPPPFSPPSPFLSLNSSVKVFMVWSQTYTNCPIL